MRRRGAELWSRAALLALAAGVLFTLADISVAPRLAAAIAVPACVVCAAALFCALARRAPPLPRVPSHRLRALAAKGLFVATTSVSEEVIWRWFVLGGLTPLLGPVAALLVSTCGFALAHGWQRTRRLVHLVTGGTFGVLFLATGSLTAVAAAHVTYNILIALAVEQARDSPPPADPPPEARPAARGLTHTTRAGSEVAAELIGVDKALGSRSVLQGIDLRLRRGEIAALLGPNGAGKTTALSLLLGLRRPDRGWARLFGHDPRLPAARRAAGATPQEMAFPPTLTVTEVIELVRAHYPHPADPRSLVSRFDLAGLERRQAGGLSGGERRRLALALAFAGNPEIVLLDEPTSGLDVGSRRAVWRAVSEFAEAGGTVLLTTHQLDEAEALATRVIVIDRGRIVADGRPAEIASRTAMKRVRLAGEPLPEVSGVERSTREGDARVLYTRDAGALVRRLVFEGCALRDLDVRPVTLEEAFLELMEAKP